mgnify:CR=1 FL=1
MEKEYQKMMTNLVKLFNEDVKYILTDEEKDSLPSKFPSYLIR